MNEPTNEQIAQTRRVECALAQELSLLASEGVPIPILLTGLGMTAAKLIEGTAGADRIAPWFDGQARLVEQLQGLAS